METPDSERDPISPSPPAPVVAAVPLVAVPVVAPLGRSVPASVCQITFGGMDPSEALRVEVRAWLEKLGALTAPMTGGHVVIEAVEEGRKARCYRVRMELVMPEGVVVVGPDHPSNAAHEDVYVAIRNAFRAARRQLESHFQLHSRPPANAAPTATGA
jgi:ribosome-associated translation inhibitor RaiA